MDWDQFVTALTAFGFVCSVREVRGVEMASVVWLCPGPSCPRGVHLYRPVLEMKYTSSILGFYLEHLIASRNVQRGACGH